MTVQLGDNLGRTSLSFIGILPNLDQATAGKSHHHHSWRGVASSVLIAGYNVTPVLGDRQTHQLGAYARAISTEAK